MTRSLVRKIVLSLIICCTLVLIGCDKVKGTYTDSMGAVTVDFKGGGKASMTMPIVGTQDVTYEVNGDKVTIQAPTGAGGQSMVLTINSDGSLSGPQPFGTLKKKS